jgi:hypothetical protein
LWCFCFHSTLCCDVFLYSSTVLWCFCFHSYIMLWCFSLFLHCFVVFFFIDELQVHFILTVLILLVAI